MCSDAQSCQTLCDPMDCSLPGSSLSMELSWQEHWSGLPFPPPADLPNPETEPVSLASPALAGGFFTASTTWETPETGMMQPQTKGYWQPQKLEEARSGFFLRVSGRSTILPTL